MSVMCIIKNEYVKLFKEKKVYIIILFLIAMCILGIVAYSEMQTIVLTGNPKMGKYSDELITILSDLNSIRFAQLFLTDFIYKDFFSLYILSMVILAVDIFVYDYENGTLKYTVLTGVNLKDVIVGKIIFTGILALGFALVNFFIPILLGSYFFGLSSFKISELKIVFLMNIFAIIPCLTIIMMVCVLSFFELSAKLVLAFSLGFSFILGVADTLTRTKFYSPIGSLFFFNGKIPNITIGYIQSLASSLIYIVILMGIILAMEKKIEFHH